jgi:hypothetical protein
MRSDPVTSTPASRRRPAADQPGPTGRAVSPKIRRRRLRARAVPLDRIDDDPGPRTAPRLLQAVVQIHGSS